MPTENSKQLKNELRFKSIMGRGKNNYEFYYSFTDILPYGFSRTDGSTTGHVLRTLKNGELIRKYSPGRRINVVDFMRQFSRNEIKYSSWNDFSVYFITGSDRADTEIESVNFMFDEYETMKNRIHQWFQKHYEKRINDTTENKSVGVVVVHHRHNNIAHQEIEEKYDLKVNYSNQYEFNGKKYKIVIPMKNLSSDVKNIVDEVFKNEVHQYSYSSFLYPTLNKKGKIYRKKVKYASKITIFSDNVKMINKFKLFGYNIPNGFIVVSKKGLEDV